MDLIVLHTGFYGGWSLSHKSTDLEQYKKCRFTNQRRTVWGM